MFFNTNKKHLPIQTTLNELQIIFANVCITSYNMLYVTRKRIILYRILYWNGMESLINFSSSLYTSSLVIVVLCRVVSTIETCILYLRSYYLCLQFLPFLYFTYSRCPLFSLLLLFISWTLHRCCVH